jgi:hypothetical protein
MPLRRMVVLAGLLALSCRASCADPQELNVDIDKLEQRKTWLTGDVSNLERQVLGLGAKRDELNGTIAELQGNEAVLRAIKEGRAVRYVLKVSIRQVHFSINIKKQIADAINEEEFELVTDKQTYDSANVGQDLFESFRMGSLLMKSSAGSWRLKIVGKRAEPQ